MSDESKLDSFVTRTDDSEASIRALLESVTKADASPSSASLLAVGQALAEPLPMTTEERSEGEYEEQILLGEFRERFWDFTPDARRNVWSVLMNRVQSTLARRTLESWEPGLNIEVAERDPAICAIARELMLLPARPKAARRIDWLHHNPISDRTLNELPNSVERHARLDLPLYVEIARRHPQSEFARFVKEALPKFTMPTGKTIDTEITRQPMRSVLKRAFTPEPQEVVRHVVDDRPHGETQYEISKWQISLAIFILMVLIRFVIAIASK